jgi:RNA polymerase sigma factor (sigma-70 family)
MTREQLSEVVIEYRSKLVRFAEVELRRRNLPAQQAEDAVQDALVDMVRSYDRIELHGEASIWTIMCQKVLDELKDRSRKTTRRQRLAPHQSLKHNDEERHETGEYSMPTTDLAVDVQRAFEKLTAEQACLVDYVKLRGWSYQETGRQLGLTKNQAQWRYECGLNSLRQTLEIYAPNGWSHSKVRVPPASLSGNSPLFTHLAIQVVTDNRVNTMWDLPIKNCVYGENHVLKARPTPPLN